MSKLESNKSRTFNVNSEHAGQRVDNFLLRELKGVPRSLIYKLIRRAKVKVNDKKTSASTKLNTNDKISVRDIDLRPDKFRERINSDQVEWLKEFIIFENELVVAINKPIGLSVHAGTGQQNGLIEMVRSLRPDLGQSDLVHRLDKLTSGCILIAKKRSALRSLHEVFRANKVSKYYDAIVYGRWDLGDIEINLKLERKRIHKQSVTVVSSKGKESVSRISLLKRNRNASHLSIELVTGRMHQIRAHLHHLGFPIIGDPKYKDNLMNEKKKISSTRMLLHATKMVFHEQIDGMPKELACKPSNEFILD